MAGKNGNKKQSERDRLQAQLERANLRITEHTEWIRALSNDLRRLGEKLYGITEGTVTLSDVKLPDGRYRTPDQSPLASADIVDAAQRMAEVRRRFVSMERDLASADDLRMQIEKALARSERRKKASDGKEGGVRPKRTVG